MCLTVLELARFRNIGGVAYGHFVTLVMRLTVLELARFRNIGGVAYGHFVTLLW